MFLGLGCHGLTADASGLTHLHVALKTELQRHVDAYKNALHRLDEVSTNCKSPTDASHHRLLSLHYSDVQQRLIDNKTLLTLIDKPALQQLRPLVETLAARVQSDKEALFCVSQLKRFGIFLAFIYFAYIFTEESNAASATEHMSSHKIKTISCIRVHKFQCFRIVLY